MKTHTAPQTLMRPFRFEGLPVRGRILRIEDLTSQINTLKAGDEGTTKTLAEMLSAAVILAHDLKDKANISLQITPQRQGPLLLAKCNYKGVLRALVKKEHVKASSATQPALPNTESIFTITVDYGRGQESYQSIVPIDTASVSETVEAYFQQSSRLPTFFKVFIGADGSGKTSCGAIFLQAMIEDAALFTDDWQRMALILSTIKPEEILPGTLSEIDLLSRLFAEDDVRVFPKQDLSFADHSNRPRMEEALKSLGVEECRTLLEEEGGTFTMTDEYTGQSEVFTEADLIALFGKAWQK